MAIELKTRTKALFEKAFPERQIYHRSGGSVRYVSISPWRQAMMAGGASVVVGWCLFATASVLLQPTPEGGAAANERVASKYNRLLQQAQAKEAAALSLLEERTLAFTRATEEFERRHETLKDLLAALKGQEGGEFATLKGDGAGVLVNASTEEADARQGRPSVMVTASVEKAGFRAQIDRIRGEQTRFLDAAEDEAVERAERYKGVMRLTGVALPRVLEAQSGGESGGPLIELTSEGAAAAGAIDPPAAAPRQAGKELQASNEINAGSDDFAARAREVRARLQEAKIFEDLIYTVPLGAPVGDGYHETSGFGKRSDPFTHALAWHNGLDIGAFMRAPIRVPAPGIVTFAGRKTGYGRVIEVDHGHDFRTRYGHLNSVDVNVGDKVALGQKIATMGTSGRSTGPHLHYEVYFRGKAYDPIKFLRAGKHVHQG